MQYSNALRTARASQIQATCGGSATLAIFSGAQPTHADDGNPGGRLVTITLPATFLASASGTATLQGTWAATASSTGEAKCFRIFDGSGACHVQGAVPGELSLSSTSITVGQNVSVTGFTINGGNA